MCEWVEFVEKEIDVVASSRWIAGDHREEVGQATETLVADQHAAFLHHHRLQLRRHLQKGKGKCFPILDTERWVRSW